MHNIAVRVCPEGLFARGGRISVVTHSGGKSCTLMRHRVNQREEKLFLRSGGGFSVSGHQAVAARGQVRCIYRYSGFSIRQDL